MPPNLPPNLTYLKARPTLPKRWVHCAKPRLVAPGTYFWDHLGLPTGVENLADLLPEPRATCGALRNVVKRGVRIQWAEFLGGAQRSASRRDRRPTLSLFRRICQAGTA